jgi:nucleoside 2-deoxyribosyltransferase
MIKTVYIAGSLKNSQIPELANQLQERGFDPFCDWISPGPMADDCWKEYSKARGWTYKQAIESHIAKNIFEFDKFHLDRCDALVLLAPAGKSAHLELGYTVGRGKPGFILFDGDPDPQRYEVMVQFATGIFFNREDLFATLKSL